MNNDCSIPMRIEQAAENLHKNGFQSSVFTILSEATAAILDYIQFDTVGIGGSMTAYQLDLYNLIKANGNNVFWHWMAPEGEADSARRKAAAADIYVCSANAITLDGKIINIDGTANRVAPMMFGPKRTLIVVGHNKICEDTESGIRRIKTQACGKNARRLKLKTPCAATNECSDCNSPDRMCRATVILERPPFGKEISVFILNEDLGY